MKCITCGKEISDKWLSSHPNRIRKFCSLECRWKNGRPDFRGDKHPNWQNKKIKMSCFYCGKIFDNYASNKKNYNFVFCSRLCRYQFLRGKNSPVWKGKGVGYSALHDWIRRHKKKLENCEFCGKEKKTEFANISGLYRRDVNDFWCLCHQCHIRFDTGKLYLD